jgi:uncharacterized protein YhjY with autotransporter beta-barrel domain
MNLRSSVFSLGAALHLSLAGFAAAQTITVPANSSDAAWGPSNSYSFGETITVPVGSDQLQSFSFAGLNTIAGGDFDYKTYIYAFNTSTSQVVGSALYTSGVQTLTSTQAPDLITPNLTVTAGDVYLVYVSSSGLTTNPNGQGLMQVNTSKPYAGGEFYQVHSLAPNSTWTGISFFNAAFTADFGFITLSTNTSFSLVPGLNSNERGIASSIDTGSSGSSSAIGHIVTALANLPVTSVAGALDQLSAAKVANFYSTSAVNAESIDAQDMDNYLAGQRLGPDGNFTDGNGKFDTSGFVVNDPNVDPGLQMLHSRMLAWNQASSGAISDIPGATLGGIDMKAIKPAPVLDDKPWSFFVRGSVILAQGLSQGDVPHFDDTSSAVTVGADYRLSPHFLVGLTAGYAHSDASLDDLGSSATVDSYSPGIYASYADGGWYSNFVGRYSYNTYTSSRVIEFLGQTADGATTGNEGTASLDGGYNFRSGGWSYGPIAGLQYTHLTVNSYNEQNSDADLAVAESQTDSLRSRLGGTVRFDGQCGGVTLSPHLEATWQHEFLDQGRGLTSQFTAFNGGSFNVQTPDSSGDSALVDLGLDAKVDETISVFGDYLFEAGQDNYFAQSVQAGVRVSF